MTSRSPRVGQRRPGGRTERVREMVATTVLDLIKNGNIDFSYNDVAEISGIHKTTLYRRWPQRIDLVKEALKQHNSLLKIPHGKTWSETAEALVKSVARFLSDPTEIALNIALFSDPSAEASEIAEEYWLPVQNQLNQLVIEAQERKELPGDIDPQTLMSTIVAPMLMMTMLTRAPLKRKYVTQLIKIVKLYSGNAG